MNNNPLNIRTYSKFSIITVSSLFVILYIVLGLGSAPMDIPIEYGRDSFHMLPQVKGIIDNSWNHHIPQIRAPFGWYLVDFGAGWHIDWAMIKALGFFNASPGWAINSYFILSILLASCTSLYVLLKLKIHPYTAIACSIVFALLPYSFLRGIGHIYLTMYMMPIGVLLAISAFSENNIHLSRREWYTLSILVGFSQVYCMFMTCLMLGCTMIGLAINESKRAALKPLKAIAIIAFCFLINISPTLIHRAQHGQDQANVLRSVYHADFLGIKIRELIIPVKDHPIAPLAFVRDKFDAIGWKKNESSLSVFGSTMSAGFLILILLLIVKRKKLHKLLLPLKSISNLNILILLFCTTSGFGVVFNRIVSPQFRAQNRVSPILAFFALLAIAFFLNYAYDRWFSKQEHKKRIFAALMALLCIFAAIDQVPHAMIKNHYWAKADEFRSDAEFIQKIESSLEENDIVYQLPEILLRNDTPDDMGEYSHGRAYIHSKTLRWTGNVLSSRNKDFFEAIAHKGSTQDMIRKMREEGFAGIYIDRYGYEDRATKLESELSKLLGDNAIVSSNQRLSYFPLN